MAGSYIESYKDLYHGTTTYFATKIVDSQMFMPSKSGWCGPGVYFYDTRCKAWWSAQRTCTKEKSTSGRKQAPAVVIADIKDLDKKLILDLRSFDNLKCFADFVDDFLSKTNFDIDDKLDEDNKIRKKENFY